MNFSRPGRNSPGPADGMRTIPIRSHDEVSRSTTSHYSAAATDEDGSDFAYPGPIQSRGTNGSRGGIVLPQTQPALFNRQPSGQTTGGSQNINIFPTPFIRSLHPAATTNINGSSVAGSSVGGLTSESRSHVPSLTSRAFLSPMSSQRLQVHRGQRPWSMQERSSPFPEDYDDMQSNTNRNSTGSAITIRGGHALPTQADIEALRAVSRASTTRTDFTEADRGYPTEFMSSAMVMASTDDLEKQERLVQEQAPQYPPNGTGHQMRNGYQSKFEPSEYTHNQYASQTNGHAYPQQQGPPSEEEKMLAQKEFVKNNLGQNYEYFTGNTRFWWGGRLQNARDKPIVIGTALIVLIPTVLFFVFSAPWLWHHASPAIPILFAYVFFICISSFLHASLTDPGILPRNIHPFPTPDPSASLLTIGPQTSDWLMVRSSRATYGAFEVPIKYCKSCNLWRPPRTHHCRVCDNCVETQDHHCMWLNNCVGRRNYRYFFAFVASGTVLGLFLFAASLAHVLGWARQNYPFTAKHSINVNRVPFAMVIYGAIIFTYPLSLWIYHTFLIYNGQTTREYLNSKKFAKADRHRPFDQKPKWVNFAAVLMRPRPPTYLEFKQKYAEGDQRFGERRGRRTAPLTDEEQGGGGTEMKQGFGGRGGRMKSFMGPIALKRTRMDDGDGG